MFNELLSLMGGQSQQQSGLRGGGRTAHKFSTRFRSARLVDKQEQYSQQAQLANPSGSGSQTPTEFRFEDLIPALFAYMEHAQQAIDRGEFDVLAKYDFMRDVVPYMQKSPLLGNKDLWGIIYYFNQLTKKPLAVNESDVVTVEHQAIEPSKQDNHLLVPINERIQTVRLQQSTLQETPEGIPGQANITTHLSLFPEIYRGIQTNIDEGSIILMPVAQKEPSNYRWRVITYIAKDLSDFVTGFVYAAIDKQQLVLANEANNIKINHYALPTQYPSKPLRHEQWLLILYACAAFLIGLGLLSKLRQ